MGEELAEMLMPTMVKIKILTDDVKQPVDTIMAHAKENHS